MMRLTLRDGRTGELLARVVADQGEPFVLDLGDPVVIAGVRERLRQGFQLDRGVHQEQVRPHSRDLLVRLAELYLRSGMLVALEEPTWMGRRRQDSVEVDPLEDEETEMVEVEDLPDVGEALRTVHPEGELPPDAETGSELPGLVDIPDVGEALRTVYPEEELVERAGEEEEQHPFDAVGPLGLAPRAGAEPPPAPFTPLASLSDHEDHIPTQLDASELPSMATLVPPEEIGPAEHEE